MTEAEYWTFKSYQFVNVPKIPITALGPSLKLIEFRMSVLNSIIPWNSLHSFIHLHKYFCNHQVQTVIIFPDSSLVYFYTCIFFYQPSSESSISEQCFFDASLQRIGRSVKKLKFKFLSKIFLWHSKKKMLETYGVFEIFKVQGSNINNITQEKQTYDTDGLIFIALDFCIPRP